MLFAKVSPTCISFYGFTSAYCSLGFECMRRNLLRKCLPHGYIEKSNRLKRFLEQLIITIFGDFELLHVIA